MIRNLLATTAIATLLASGAYAQTAPAPAPQDPMATQQAAPMVIHAEGHLASNIIGERVYNGTHDDAERIGDVNDLVIGPEGDVQAIVIGVGGFLGLGQKNVAIEYELVEWAERDNDRWMVVETTRETLEQLPDFDRQAFRPMPADAQVGETRPASAEDLGVAAATPEPASDADGTAASPTVPAGDTAAAPADDAEVTDETAAAPADDAEMAEDTAAAPADDAEMAEDTAAAPAEDAEATEDTAAAPADDAEVTEDTAAAPVDDVEATDETAVAPAVDEEATTAAIDRSTLEPFDTTGISADELIGTTVYGANEENVGSVGDVILSEDGTVDAIIIDVGGFLGIGSKEVAVGLDNLAFMSDGDGNHYLYTEFTEEQLEAQPAYDEATWVDNRDEQRLVVPN